MVEKLDQANFHPSAFAWGRDRVTLIIVSAKGHSAIEIDQQGRLVDRIERKVRNTPALWRFAKAIRKLRGDVAETREEKD